jgi:hypothetical protein
MLRRCGRCRQEKSVDDFAWRYIERGLRDNYCRPCRSAYKKEHYSKHRDRYISNARDRRTRVKDERVRFLVDYLREHPCVDCGEEDVVVLEFDHLRDKSFGVSSGLLRNWGEVLAEIEKCEVVCANCHRRRTAARGGFRRAALALQDPQLPLFSPNK